MVKSSVIARVLEGDRLECQVESPKGKKLMLSGATTDIEPTLSGPPVMQQNRALVHNAWSFAKFTHLKVNLPTEEEQANAEKRAKAHRKEAAWIAGLVDDLTASTRQGWCSGCFRKVDHQKVRRTVQKLPAYVCTNCGSPTLPCADPVCHNMAVRGRGAVKIPRYCAEHRHDIPGFAKADRKMGELSDYQAFLKYDKKHLSMATKYVGIGLIGIAVGAPAALVAAPAIGGAVGTLVGGYTGAAATSYGLALLGGGSIAAGGLGMAGGTAVVTAAGGALGGALGASVTNAYVREDKSFHIEMLRGGPGVPVIVCNGFLSEKGSGWGEWKQMVTTRYPDSPIYRVHWGAKELKDLGRIASFTAVKTASTAALKDAALAATKAGTKKLGPLGPVLLAAGLAKNPWHVAKNRADKTGVVLADLLARTTEDAYVLVGHSLGARVMVVAAQTLSTKVRETEDGTVGADGPQIEAAHLTGAAIGAHSDWDSLTARVRDTVYNYFSKNDKVLKYLYAAAMGGQSAAGRVGFTPCPAKLKNVDVSAEIERHSDYYTELNLL